MRDDVYNLYMRKKKTVKKVTKKKTQKQNTKKKVQVKKNKPLQKKAKTTKSKPKKTKKTVKKTPSPKRIELNSKAHRALGVKAAKQAERVLEFFEREAPRDDRPRQAIDVLKLWAYGRVETSMLEVSTLSLAAHAAARDVNLESAQYAARAAGEALAVWHTPQHAKVVPLLVQKALAARREEKKKRA